MLSTAQKLVV